METVACSANVTASNLVTLQAAPVAAGFRPGSQTEPAAKWTGVRAGTATCAMMLPALGSKRDQAVGVGCSLN